MVVRERPLLPREFDFPRPRHPDAHDGGPTDKPCSYHCGDRTALQHIGVPLWAEYVVYGMAPAGEWRSRIT